MMRKIVIREDKEGNFHLKNFGLSFASENGLSPFDLAIESKSLKLNFPRVVAYDLFTKLDLAGADFKADRLEIRNIVKVREEEREIVVEASSGTFYDFLKERYSTENCLIHSNKTVAFYWSGNDDRANDQSDNQTAEQDVA